MINMSRLLRAAFEGEGITTYYEVTEDEFAKTDDTVVEENSPCVFGEQVEVIHLVGGLADRGIFLIHISPSPISQHIDTDMTSFPPGYLKILKGGVDQTVWHTVFQDNIAIDVPFFQQERFSVSNFSSASPPLNFVGGIVTI
jgi:hypothetical protein